MVSVLASSVVGCGFDHQPGQIKDIKTVISCFSAKHAAFRRKSKAGQPRVRIIFLGTVSWIAADCCFSH